jgi:DNA-binding transcriptional ArsR family regulator
VAALGASSEALSPTQIAGIIGTSLGATAYHVRVLERVGVVELVREGRVRGAIEHFFGLAADRDDSTWTDRASQLLGACDALTVTLPGGHVTIVEIDRRLRADLDELLATIKPSVDGAVSDWLVRTLSRS